MNQKHSPTARTQGGYKHGMTAIGTCTRLARVTSNGFRDFLPPAKDVRLERRDSIDDRSGFVCPSGMVRLHGHTNETKLSYVRRKVTVILRKKKAETEMRRDRTVEKRESMSTKATH